MADITNTLENQQALQGEGKLVRTTEGGEPKRQGKTETMLRLIAAGAKPGNPKDAADLLSKMDSDTAKSILREYGIDPEALKSAVMDVLKEYKVTPQQVAEATGEEVTNVLAARRAQEAAVPQGTPVTHVKVEETLDPGDETKPPTTVAMMPKTRRRSNPPKPGSIM